MTTWIIITGILMAGAGAAGFFACALFASRRIAEKGMRIAELEVLLQGRGIVAGRTSRTFANPGRSTIRRGRKIWTAATFMAIFTGSLAIPIFIVPALVQGVVVQGADGNQIFGLAGILIAWTTLGAVLLWLSIPMRRQTVDREFVEKWACRIQDETDMIDALRIEASQWREQHKDNLGWKMALLLEPLIEDSKRIRLEASVKAASIVAGILKDLDIRTAEGAKS